MTHQNYKKILERVRRVKIVYSLFLLVYTKFASRVNPQQKNLNCTKVDRYLLLFHFPWGMSSACFYFSTSVVVVALLLKLVAVSSDNDSEHRLHLNHATPCHDLQKQFSISTKIVCPTSNAALYEKERHQFIEHFDQYPLGIVYPQNTLALSEILAYAAAHFSAEDCPLAVRSGGHDNLGRSTATGSLVVDLSLMSSVKLLTSDDDRPPRAVIGGGTKLIDVVDVLRSSSLGGRSFAFPLGDCRSVGVTGFALSGGISVLTHAFGLGLDAIVGIEAVLVNGTILSLPSAAAGLDDDYTSLFAAFRGAAPHFAVVSEITVSLTEVPDYFLLRKSLPIDAFERCLSATSRFTHLYPGLASIYLSYGSSGLRILVVAADNRRDRVMIPLGQTFFSENCPLPLNDDVAVDRMPRKTFWESYMEHVSVEASRSFKNYSSQMRDNHLSKDDVVMFAAEAHRLVSSLTGHHHRAVDVDFIVTTIAGAMNKVPNRKTAWAHRTTTLVLAASCTAFRREDDEAHCHPWATEAFALLRLYGNPVQAIYPNDASSLVKENPQEAYYGRENLDWLRDVKRALDPENRLAAVQGIRP